MGDKQDKILTRMNVILSGIAVALFLLVLNTSFAKAATQTINTLPSANSTFITDTQTFLKDEVPQRSPRSTHVVIGGIGATSASLAHTISTIYAYVEGYYLTDASISHTYTASKDTFVLVRANTATTITIAGAAITYDGNFVFAEMTTGTSQPNAPAGTMMLFEAVTDGTSITTINDYRTGGEILLSDPRIVDSGNGRLDAAIDLVGTLNTTIVVDVDDTLSTDATVVNGCVLKIEPGALITVDNCTLTINGGPDVLPDQYWINEVGTGKVVFESIPTTYPDWWADNTPGITEMAGAINSAINAANKVTIIRDCLVSTPIYVYDDTFINFEPNAELKNGATTGYVIRTLSSVGGTYPTTQVKRVKIHNLKLDMDSKGYVGIMLECATVSDIINPYIYNVPSGTFDLDDGQFTGETSIRPKAAIYIKGINTVYGAYRNRVVRPKLYGSGQSGNAGIALSSSYGDVDSYTGNDGTTDYSMTSLPVNKYLVIAEFDGVRVDPDDTTDGYEIDTVNSEVDFYTNVSNGVELTLRNSNITQRANANTIINPYIISFTTGISVLNGRNNLISDVPELSGNDTCLYFGSPAYYNTVASPYMEDYSTTSGFGILIDYGSQNNSILGIGPGEVAGTDVEDRGVRTAYENTRREGFAIRFDDANLADASIIETNVLKYGYDINNGVHDYGRIKTNVESSKDVVDGFATATINNFIPAQSIIFAVSVKVLKELTNTTDATFKNFSIGYVLGGGGETEYVFGQGIARTAGTIVDIKDNVDAGIVTFPFYYTDSVDGDLRIRAKALDTTTNALFTGVTDALEVTIFYMDFPTY